MDIELGGGGDGVLEHYLILTIVGLLGALFIIAIFTYFFPNWISSVTIIWLLDMKKVLT